MSDGSSGSLGLGGVGLMILYTAYRDLRHQAFSVHYSCRLKLIFRFFFNFFLFIHVTYECIHIYVECKNTPPTIFSVTMFTEKVDRRKFLDYPKNFSAETSEKSLALSH